MTLASRLITITSLAASLCCFLQAVPATALSIESHAPRALHHNLHDALAKRKRSTKGKRCKPRPASSSSAAPSPSPSPSPSPTKAHFSSAASPSLSPSHNSGGSNAGTGKAGLGWGGDNNQLAAWSAVKTMYNWGPDCPSNAKSLGITCCPMLWGWRQVADWQNNVMNTSPDCVMGPNEPEIAGQSNMSPDSGVDLFTTYITPMAEKGASVVVSPATTSDPAGKTWMIEFYQKCGSKRCGITHHGCHWYDVTGDKMIAYLTDLQNTFKMPMWVTEFACQNFNGGPQCTLEQVQAFQRQMTAFFAATSWIEKFFPFGVMPDMQGVNTDNQLMDSNGNPNAFAKAYFGL